eukprot:IDg6453t1
MKSEHRYLVDPASGICLSQRLSHASLSSVLPWWQRVTDRGCGTPEREPEKRLPHPRKAAGALSRIQQRASLVPAAAVIPAL